MAVDNETFAAAKAYTDKHGGGGGGTSNYNSLTNKPSINGVELNGNKTAANLSLVSSNDIGDAAGKSVTTYISPENQDLPTSEAVYRAMSAMLYGVFHPAGEKTVAQLTSALLIAENIGNAYDIIDSGVTDDNWFGGAGQTINAGNMAIVNKADGDTYKFKLQSGINIDMSAYQTVLLSAGIVVDGVTKTSVEDTLNALNTLSASNKTGLADKANKVSGATSGHLAALDSNGNLIDSGKSASELSGGHTIKDDGSSMTARTGLNFIDHDVTDDSTNNETDVKPHLLNNEEFDEIMANKPSAGTVMIANKFSKGELYYTEEKMIGRWIDGKPLYQKTVAVTLPDKSTTNTGIAGSFTAHGISNFGSLISADLVWHDTDENTWWHNQVDYKDYGIANYGLQVNSTTIRIISNNPSSTGIDWSSRTNNCYVTLKYTKTTDTAVSIGDSTDYSTTEKIIGTWIDGKPLYQKVFELSTGTDGVAGSTWATISGLLDGLHVDTILLATMRQKNTKIFYPCTAQAIGTGGIDLQYMHFRTNSTGFDMVILQYTKTTV